MSRDTSYLQHISDSIDKILTYTADGEEEFSSDTMVQDAVIRNLEIIGEAVKNLSDDLKDQYEDIPWRSIAGMRDKLIHNYFGVKLEIVWDTVVKVLPDFHTQIENILSEDQLNQSS